MTFAEAAGFPTEAAGLAEAAAEAPGLADALAAADVEAPGFTAEPTSAADAEAVGLAEAAAETTGFAEPVVVGFAFALPAELPLDDTFDEPPAPAKMPPAPVSQSSFSFTESRVQPLGPGHALTGVNLCSLHT